MPFESLSQKKGLARAASEEEIARAETNLRMVFPRVYRALLGFANGFLLENGITFYSTSDIGERNSTFEIAIYCPGYLLVGDDSGGRGFLINPQEDDPSVYLSDLGSLFVDEFELLADTLSALLERGFPDDIFADGRG